MDTDGTQGLVLYIGTLAASSADTPVEARAEPALAARLIPWLPSVHRNGGLAKAPHGRLKRRKASQYKLTYYACTFAGCGWRGSAVKHHRIQRPACPSYPSLFNYERGESVRDATAAFLSRCTAQQRELGLPPDGAKPIPLPGPDGLVDPDVLYLTVPCGLSGGDSFTVSMGRGSEACIAVPPDKCAGDVLAISAHGGKRQVFDKRIRCSHEHNAAARIAAPATATIQASFDLEPQHDDNDASPDLLNRALDEPGLVEPQDAHSSDAELTSRSEQGQTG